MCQNKKSIPLPTEHPVCDVYDIDNTSMYDTKMIELDVKPNIIGKINIDDLK